MVYICIPAYNEERTIGVVLWKIRQVMSDFDRDYQVLVVDDASTDGTGDVIEPYARIMPVHVRRHERREGYAASLDALLREAVARSTYPKRDVVVTLQADFTDEPEDVATLVKRIEGGADVVTGRLQPAPKGMPRLVRWSRRLWSYLLRRLRGGNGEADLFSGFRAYRVIVLRKAIEAEGDRPLATGDVWAASAELLGRVVPHARRTEAVDIRVHPVRRQRTSRFDARRASAELAHLFRSGRGAAPPAPAEAAGDAAVGSIAARDAPGPSGGAGESGRKPTRESA